MCNVKCDQCDFKADDIASIITHIRIVHRQSLKCGNCDYIGNDYGDLAKHSTESHEDTTLISTMYDHVKDGLVQVEVLRKMLLQVIQGQNEMKQELFVLRNMQMTAPIQKCAKETYKEKSYAEVTSTAASISVSNVSPKVPQPQQTSAQQTTSLMSPQNHQQSHSSSKPFQASVKNQQDRSKILFVGDSISQNINIKSIEKATGKEVVYKRAYSAVYDINENVAKKAAIFPASNFTDVVPDLLNKSDFHSLLLQSGSVDISNLNTKDNPAEYIEYFKQETMMSAKNMFAVAVNALQVKPSLEKVVLMKQIPRYDTAETVPLSLKPALSQLFNSTLMEQWMDCPYKEKLVIGTQNIECYGALNEARYRETMTGKYDGVHLYGSSGRKAYTNSVLNILNNANLVTEDYQYHKACPQASYQASQFQHNIKCNNSKYSNTYQA